MKTLRRLIWREVASSVAFATLAFLALFFFFDVLDELRWVGRSSSGVAGAVPWQLSHALLYVLLGLPKHLYELLPITVLIGTIFVMARLAQSSEFTIMRTSGLGPWRALSTLLLLGAGFVVVTFAMGDYLAPVSERAAQRIKALRQGHLSSGATGAWLKERQGEQSFAVNVRALSTEGQLYGVRIFAFDAEGRVAATVQAGQGIFDTEGQGWQLSQVQLNVFSLAQSDTPHVERQQHTSLHWPTDITPEMVATALLKPDRMPTLDLFRYIRHLKANGQAAQRYEIEFWRKVFYPLSCLVMVVLALPFAYLHFRSGGIAGYVFGGVMAGISFFLLNNVFGFAGNLHQWNPWLTAAAPGLIYSALSLAAFGWLVLRH